MKLHIKYKNMEKSFCGKDDSELYQHENVIRPKDESELSHLLIENVINAMVLCKKCMKKLPHETQYKINNGILEKQIEEMSGMKSNSLGE